MPKFCHELHNPRWHRRSFLYRWWWTIKEDDTIIQETLRHFSPPRQRVVQLRTQTHETSGRVSMAGTLWEASPLLADYISNPACSPLFKNDDASTLTCSQPRSVVELGSGVGLASLAAIGFTCSCIYRMSCSCHGWLTVIDKVIEWELWEI